MLKEAKKRVDNINEALRNLEDPIDQLRHKSDRLKSLAGQEKKLLQKLWTSCQVIEDTEAEVATLRERIHDINDEQERIKSEQRIPVLQGTGGKEQLLQAPSTLQVLLRACGEISTACSRTHCSPKPLRKKELKRKQALLPWRTLLICCRPYLPNTKQLEH